MKKMLNKVFVRTFVIPYYYDSGTEINYGSGFNSLTSYGSGSGSTREKVTVPTVPVPVAQHWSQLLPVKAALYIYYCNLAKIPSSKQLRGYL